MDSIGKRIKKLRTEAGLTQSELAKRLGISTSTVGMYEHGRRNPDSFMLIKLGKQFSVSVDHLLGIDDQTNEATEIIAKMSEMIMKGKDIMLNGFPMSIADKEKLIYTIEFAINMLLEEKRKAFEQENVAFKL